MYIYKKIKLESSSESSCDTLGRRWRLKSNNNKYKKNKDMSYTLTNIKTISTQDKVQNTTQLTSLEEAHGN